MDVAHDNLSNFESLLKHIRRNPSCHEENFLCQISHFEQICTLYGLNHAAKSDELVESITFIGDAVKFYPKYVARFIKKLTWLVSSKGELLNSHERLGICRALLKYKAEPGINTIDIMTMILNFFKFKDKLVRRTLLSRICANLKNSSKKKGSLHGDKLYSFFFDFFKLNSGEMDLYILSAVLRIIVSMWSNNVCRSTKLVNVIASACFSDKFKISYTAIRFFLGLTFSDENEEEEHDAEELDAMLIVKKSKEEHKNTLSRLSQKREKKLTKAVEFLNKIEEKKKAREEEKAIGDTSAIRCLDDPQTFGEKLMKLLSKSKNTLEFKLTTMEVIARVISVHQLIILNFYSFVQRYLRPHQEGAVRILASLTQACHEYVPEDTVHVCIKTLADNFISQHSAPEISAVGINTIREICWRCPQGIDQSLAEELVDLCKGTNVDRVLLLASKSLLQTLRVVNPSVLKKKDRGRSSVYKAVNQNDSNIFESTYNSDDEFNDDLEESNLEDIACTRFLTDEELEQVRKMNLLGRAKKISNVVGISSFKIDSNLRSDDVITTDKIGFVEGLKKKDTRPEYLPKSLELEGREDRSAEFRKKRFKEWRFNPKASKTDDEKKKNKAFMMTRNKKSVKAKKKRSYVEQLACVKKSLRKAGKLKR